MTTCEGQASCLWATPAALPEGGLGTRDIARGAAGMLVGPAGCGKPPGGHNRCADPQACLHSAHYNNSCVPPVTSPCVWPLSPGHLVCARLSPASECPVQPVVEHVRCRSGMRHGCLLSGNKRVLQVGRLQK